MVDKPFWMTKTLEELTPSEWESLCDGCGRCCLNKLEDYDTGQIEWTNVSCTLFNGNTCRCTQYETRQEVVPDCISLTPEIVRTIAWLPPSCAYRLIRDGQPLYWWHPLVSGDPDTVHQAGISARGRTVSEDHIPVEAFEDYLVDWPGEIPAVIEPEKRRKPERSKGE